MGRVAFTGFEWQGSAEVALSAGTFSYSTTTVNPGGSVASLRTNPGAGTGYNAIRQFGATGAFGVFSVATLFSTLYFRYATKPAANDEPILVTSDSTGNVKMEVRLNSAGNLVAYDKDIVLMATGATVLAANTWYRLDVKIGTGAAAAWEIRIDGVSEVSGTGNLLATNNASFFFGKWVNRNSNAVDFFYDDVWLDDAAYKGAHVVVPKHPNAAGSTQQWTAGTGTSGFAEVDEVIPAAADYVQSTASGDVGLFHVEDAATAPAVSGTIHSVLVLNRVRENAAGTSLFNTRLRSNATNSDNTTLDPGTAAVTNGRYVDLDPNTAAAWTTGGIDAVEIGGVDTASNALRLETCTLMVSFTAAAGGRGLFRTSHLDGLSAAGSFFADPLGG